MPVRVADASALAAVLFLEPGAESIAERLDNAQLVAPRLLELEIANVCLTKVRRHHADRAKLLRGWDRFRRLDVVFLDLDPGRVMSVAEETGLTVYDASYLLLARDQGVDLVTLDRRLAEAYRVSPGTP
jgi:predicted nucleic acid-binding protein